ncbi:hypothetical protein ACHRV6_17385 [Flavobacterium sp. FlaQc-51]|uniref:hypothetical protein n=1 Tax=Flavobacterium sp. FlaQc-51 TaxID=3374184 RepID=UPI003757ECFC
MKKIFFYSITFLCLISCKEKDPISLREIISNETVTITSNLKNSSVTDSVSIIIPMEFEIIINKSSLKFLKVDFFSNKKYRIIVDDYEIYDLQNKTKPILNFKSYLSSKKPFYILLKEKNHLISKKNAQELLEKYNIKKSLDNLKFGDTLNLISYNKFREDNIKILKELRRIEDKIRITTSCKGEDFFHSQDFKINW